MKPRLAVIIPTRNRPDLVRIAIRSVLDQRGEGVRVVVSDNSTRAEAVADVAAFCRGLDGVTCIRPPDPLSMSDHWSWILRQAATGAWGDHIAFLTDRMLLRAGQLRTLLDIIERHPREIVTYLIDAIRDDLSPIRFNLHAWSGRLVRVEADTMLRLLARAEMPLSAPLLLNSVVPVETLAALQRQHAAICDSTAPDYCFCLKLLDVVDSFLFLDKPLLVQHGMPVSNGLTFTTGRDNDVRRDFLANLPKGEAFNACAPIPGIPVAVNTAVHEYGLRRKRGGRRVLPPLDLAAYHQQVYRQVMMIEDEDQRRRFLSMLPPGTRPPERGSMKPGDHMRKTLRRILWPLCGPVCRAVWCQAARRGVQLPGLAWLGFDDPGVAREIAARFMLRPGFLSVYGQMIAEVAPLKDA